MEKPAPARDPQKLLGSRSAYPAQRNPILLFRFVGSFLLRFEARVFRGLLFHEPPRSFGPAPLSASITQKSSRRRLRRVHEMKVGESRNYATLERT